MVGGLIPKLAQVLLGVVLDICLFAGAQIHGPYWHWHHTPSHLHLSAPIFILCLTAPFFSVFTLFFRWRAIGYLLGGLAFLAVLCGSLSESKTIVVPMTRPFSPCVALSETSQIHQTFGTIPIVAEMDMSNNADELYAETFGPNATREERHGKNYNCMISMSQKVSSLVDALLSRLLEVLSLRTKSFGVIKSEPEILHLVIILSQCFLENEFDDTYLK